MSIKNIFYEENRDLLFAISEFLNFKELSCLSLVNKHSRRVSLYNEDYAEVVEIVKNPEDARRWLENEISSKMFLFKSRKILATIVSIINYKVKILVKEERGVRYTEVITEPFFKKMFENMYKNTLTDKGTSNELKTTLMKFGKYFKFSEKMDLNKNKKILVSTWKLKK